MLRSIALVTLLALMACGAPTERHYAPSERMTVAEHAALDGVLADSARLMAEHDVVRERYYTLQGVYDTPSIIIVHTRGRY